MKIGNFEITEAYGDKEAKFAIYRENGEGGDFSKEEFAKLTIRRDLGISSGQKCPVLQGLDEFAQLRLGSRVGLNGGVEGGPL